MTTTDTPDQGEPSHDQINAGLVTGWDLGFGQLDPDDKGPHIGLLTLETVNRDDLDRRDETLYAVPADEMWVLAAHIAATSAQSRLLAAGVDSGVVHPGRAIEEVASDTAGIVEMVMAAVVEKLAEYLELPTEGNENITRIAADMVASAIAARLEALLPVVEEPGDDDDRP